GNGIGTKMLRAFVSALFEDERVSTIQIDPSPDNARAIACFRKAGFREVGVVGTPDGPALLMRTEASPRRARLTTFAFRTYHGELRATYAFTHETPTVTVGRYDTCDVSLPTVGNITKFQSKFRSTLDGWTVEDLHSTVGTRVNGEVVHEP